MGVGDERGAFFLVLSFSRYHFWRAFSAMMAWEVHLLLCSPVRAAVAPAWPVGFTSVGQLGCL